MSYGLGQLEKGSLYTYIPHTILSQMCNSFGGSDITRTRLLPPAALLAVGYRMRPSCRALPFLLLDPPLGLAVTLAFVPRGQFSGILEDVGLAVSKEQLVFSM